jgi:acetylornithine deacetylase/succinyl-diaminopimelate desuccinylase family protein
VGVTAQPGGVLETLASLVRSNSVNPAYAGGVPEAAIAAVVREFFEARGIRVFEQEVLPGRPNVIAVLPGRDPSRRIVFEAHLDTASAEGMTIDPYEPRISGGKLYGRGACDTKGALAAMMHAVASLAAEKATPPCEVWLAATADEEFAYRGVLRLREGLRAEAAVVAEPTSLRLVAATKGCVRFRIVTRGMAAHSSKPHLGRSAIAAMARVVLAMEEASSALSLRVHPLLGPATCSIGTIHGGRQVNIVPDECAVEVDRRLLPGESPAGALEECRNLVASLPGVEAEVEAPMLSDEPLETPLDSPVVRCAAGALSGMGLDPAPCGVPYGSDASKLARAGIPGIVFGPGSIDLAHAAVEYVECDEVEKALEFYRRFALGFE